MTYMKKYLTTLRLCVSRAAIWSPMVIKPGGRVT